MWEMYLQICAHREDSDQPAYPCSLISIGIQLTSKDHRIFKFKYKEMTAQPTVRIVGWSEPPLTHIVSVKSDDLARPMKLRDRKFY